MGLLLLAFFLALALFSSIYGYNARRKTNYGFGPDWDCQSTGTLATLNCIKRAPWNRL